MTSRVGVVAFAVAIVAGACGHSSTRAAESQLGTIGSLPRQLPRDHGPHLLVPHELRLARTLPEGTFSFAIPIANSGDTPLHVREVRTGCLCTTVQQWPRTLGPGARGQVIFRFDSSWDGPGQHGEAIDFVTDDPAYGTTRPPLAHDRWVFFTVAT